MQAAHNHIPLTINKSRPDAAAMLHPDLSFQLFRDIVISTYDSRVALIGPNAAPNARNDCMYHGCTEHLRNSLCGDAGWNISEARGVSSVVDPANHIRIACSTDGGPNIGIEGHHPTFNRKKGAGTRALGCVVDQHIPGLEPKSSRDFPTVSTCVLYYFLIHIDNEKAEIRMELVNPHFDSLGNVVAWKNRIIIPAVNIKSTPVVTPKHVPAPQIIITRKVS